MNKIGLTGTPFPLSVDANVTPAGPHGGSAVWCLSLRRVELFSSVVVLRRLLQRTESDERGSLTGGELGATKLVGLALYGLIAYIVLSAGVALVFRFEPAASPLGIGLTIVSLLIMAVLWRWRLALADRLGSPALRGDAACSMVCLYMAAVALAGLLLNQFFGLWWADPLAALALVWWIRGEAKEATEASKGSPTTAT